MVTIFSSSTVSLLLLLFSTLGLTWTASVHSTSEAAGERDDVKTNLNIDQSNDEGHTSPRTKSSSPKATNSKNASRLLTWDDDAASKEPKPHLLFDSSVGERSITNETVVNNNRTTETTVFPRHHSSDAVKHTIDASSSETPSRSRRQTDCRRDGRCGFNGGCVGGQCRREGFGREGREGREGHDSREGRDGRRGREGREGGGGREGGLPGSDQQGQCQRRFDCPGRQPCIRGRCSPDNQSGGIQPNAPGTGNLVTPQPGTTNVGGNGGNGFVIINVLGGNGGQGGSTFTVPRGTAST